MTLSLSIGLWACFSCATVWHEIRKFHLFWLQRLKDAERAPEKIGDSFPCILWYRHKVPFSNWDSIRTTRAEQWPQMVKMAVRAAVPPIF